MAPTTKPEGAVCPRRYDRVVDRETGELRQVSCLSYRCGHCGPRLALATVAAIELAGSHSSAVLTFRSSPWELRAGKPENFAAFFGAMKSLARILRSQGHSWETAWLVEVSPRGIPHAHLLQSGSLVPPPQFTQATREAGFGWASTQPIAHLRTIARYVLKAPLRGLDLTTAQATKVMDRHLRLNGGWLIRYTRRFWKAPDGRVLAGVRQARIEALAALRETRSRPARGQDG
jgi:hypothetical protein